MYNHQNVQKSGFGQSVCVSVCPSVCLAEAFSANYHGRKGKPIELKLYGHVRLDGALRRINFCGVYKMIQ